jgi:D-threonate/D-erythronate kinase
VADDLTGACDAGVAFAPAVVVLRDTVKVSAEDALVYTTNSRDEVETVAAARVAGLMRRLPPADLVFKKIDSLLRGHVRAELAAMLASLSGRRRALVCPAFPEQGRTVANGVAKPAGVDLAALLEGLAVEIPDAVTQDDLHRIAAAADPARDLIVGSAGLARALGRVPTRLAIPQEPGPGVALFCIGSIHPVTLHQLDRLNPAEADCCRIEMTSPDPAQLALLRKRAERMAAGGMFLCGGDTALLVCRLLGAEGIRLEAEIEPGVPMGRLLGGVGDGLAVATKSGGFGRPETLSCVARVLSAQNRKSG